MRNHAVVNAGTKVLFPNESIVFGDRVRSARHQAPGRRLLAMLGLWRQTSVKVPTQFPPKRSSRRRTSIRTGWLPRSIAAAVADRIFADSVVQVGAADSAGPLPMRPFTGEKVISASARTRTSPPRIEGEKPQTA